MTAPSSVTVLLRMASVRARLFADSHAWLVLLLAIPALLPLSAPGYFLEAHDARHSIFYLVEFDRALQDGAWWPVWGPDHAIGFGYPLWLIYAPAAFIVAECFHLLGLGFAAAVKVTWAVGFLAGALGMYRLVRRWWGPAAGVIAGLAFTYAPYRLVQIYVRAALAEFISLAWLPWVLLALVALWEKPDRRRAAVGGLAFGVLLLTHTASTVAFVPLLLGLCAALLLEELRRRRPDPAAGRKAIFSRIGWTTIALALGVVLASIFLVPLLAERRYIVEEQWVSASYSYAQNFVYPHQFFDPAWGFGYSEPGPRDGMSFQLGLIIFLLAVLGGCAALARRSPALPRRLFAVAALIAALAAVFAMTPASAAIWQTLSLIRLIQFPWRLLAVTSFTLALLSGVATTWLKPSPEHGPSPAALVYVAALALVLSSFAYTRPQLEPLRPQDEQPLAVIDFELEYPDMRGMTRWSERPPVNADSPLLEAYLAGKPLRKAAIAAGQGTILEQSSTALSASARIRAEGPVRLRFYTYYFPGWRATIDGKEAEITPDPPNGLIGLELPAGEHSVYLRFGATPVRRAGAIASAAGLAIAAVLLIRQRRRPGTA